MTSALDVDKDEDYTPFLLQIIKKSSHSPQMSEAKDQIQPSSTPSRRNSGGEGDVEYYWRRFYMTFFLVSKKKIKNVKAIRKLRINSPGSGSTSDLI
jgi:hypothetical protein